MKLSVIIPTVNRGGLLDKALDSIAKQTLDQNLFEVIVVDNGSTDSTELIVNSFMGKIKNLVYIYDKNPGLHVGRHRGLFAAKADILVYGDDDIEATPTWLEGVIESFEDEKVALVGGKNLPKFEVEPPQWIKCLWEKDKKIEYLSIIDLGEQKKEISPAFVFGCNFSIRKSVLQEAKGFHPDGMPKNLIKYRGDGETYVAKFIQNRGYKALYNPKASVYHFVPKERMTKDYFKMRAFLEGISQSYTDIRYGNKTLNLMKEKIKIFMKDVLGRDVEIYKSYIKGYEYHQNEIKRDRKLLIWVMKDSYLE